MLFREEDTDAECLKQAFGLRDSQGTPLQHIQA